jgi:hypothetical protein
MTTPSSFHFLSVSSIYYQRNNVENVPLPGRDRLLHQYHHTSDSLHSQNTNGYSTRDTLSGVAPPQTRNVLCSPIIHGQGIRHVRHQSVNLPFVDCSCDAMISAILLLTWLLMARLCVLSAFIYLSLGLITRSIILSASPPAGSESAGLKTFRTLTP